MTLLKIIFQNCSPAVSKLLADFLKSLRYTAAKSKKDWDKVAVHAVFLVFGVDYKSK